MPTAATTADWLPPCDDQALKTVATLSHVILAGMIKLQEDNTALLKSRDSLRPFFHEECQEFRNKNPGQVLREWQQEKIERPKSSAN